MKSPQPNIEPYPDDCKYFLLYCFAFTFNTRSLLSSQEIHKLINKAKEKKTVR